MDYARHVYLLHLIHNISIIIKTKGKSLDETFYCCTLVGSGECTNKYLPLEASEWDKKLIRRFNQCHYFISCLNWIPVVRIFFLMLFLLQTFWDSSFCWTCVMSVLITFENIPNLHMLYEHKILLFIFSGHGTCDQGKAGFSREAH